MKYSYNNHSSVKDYTMLDYTNEFAVSVSLINRINSDIELYSQLEDNYIECLHDVKNANRCYEYRHALIELSIEIDKITTERYVNLSVYDILASESFIWHMLWYIGKKIDHIMSFGFCYVMRDSPKLQNQLHMYKYIYKHINTMCKAYDVYCQIGEYDNGLQV